MIRLKTRLEFGSRHIDIVGYEKVKFGLPGMTYLRVYTLDPSISKILSGYKDSISLSDKLGRVLVSGNAMVIEVLITWGEGVETLNSIVFSVLDI